MSETTLTYNERNVLMHTMGLDRRNVAYRNFFSADEGHNDMPYLRSLVEKGFMVCETSAISPGYIFRATKEGKEALQRYWKSC